MRNAAVDSPIIDVNDKYYLLIPSRCPPIALFERISTDNHDEIANVESLTNPRLQEKHRLIRADPKLDDKSPGLQNWNHAPFTYGNPEGSRFFGPESQCLELSGDIQTALAVSVARRERFLSRTSEPRINLDMRVITRQVRGKFIDGRRWPLDLKNEDYRGMGAEIKTMDNVDGVLFRSPERPTGERIGVLNGATLDTAVQADHYRYVWDGTRIGSLYAFNGGEVIDPCDLINEETILAA